MADRHQPLGDFVQPLIGLPAWGVEQGYGSFLRFQFEEPRLIVDERLSKAKPERLAYVRGTWEITTWCCHWRILDGKDQLAWSENEREVIGRATANLNGQKLTAITPNEGRSVFHFDLGGSLETWPYEDEISDQWTIFADHDVFTYRGDGFFACGPGDTLPDEQKWQKLV